MITAYTKSTKNVIKANPTAGPMSKWISLNYDDTSWISPYNWGTQGNPMVNAWKNYPTNWPSNAADAHWIWGVPYTGNAPVGYNYFRRKFTLTEPTEVTIYATCDDQFNLYLNEKLVLNGTTFQTTYTFTATLLNDEQILAVRGYNGGWEASLLVAIKRISDGAIILRSNTDWKCLAYPATPP